MDIAIIGAGNVGRALATSMTRAGHHVTFAANHPEHARQAAAEVGAAAAQSSAEAVRGADVVVLAVPYGAVDAVAGEIASEAAGKVLIDVTNPLTPDFSGLAVEGTSAAEEIQRRLPDATVVKAFNTLFASNQASPRKDLQALIASDDEAARQQVLDLAGSMGFSPLAVGPLRAARTLEAMAFLNIGLNVANGWGWTSAWVLES